MGKLGAIGENTAKEYLRGLGREILDANYHSRYGEIDIIASDGDCVCFVEVRARSQGDMVTGAESVDSVKKKKLARTAAEWLAAFGKECVCRFDVIEIELNGQAGRVLRLIEGAFECPIDDGWS